MVDVPNDAKEDPRLGCEEADAVGQKSDDDSVWYEFAKGVIEDMHISSIRV